MPIRPELAEVRFTGPGDVVEWLNEVNCDHPRIIPVNPGVGEAAVACEYENGPRIAVARGPVIQLTKPRRLWFCKVPVGELLQHTTVSPSWLETPAGDN